MVLLMAGTHPIERTLATFTANLEFDDLPVEAVTLVERAFTDTIGVTLAGVPRDIGCRIASFVSAQSDVGTGGASLIGRDERAPVPTATFANATTGHALDYDDLSWGMDGHPSVTLVAPILALGETAGASGADAITAFAAGFETECCLAEPISPTHYELGWHATATFGTFGATAAACSILGMDAEETEQAIGIAASMASGLKQNFGSMSKPLQVGLASRSGVTAALLADDGFTSGGAPVSGDSGFFALYSDGSITEPNSPGDPFHLRTEGINVKYYPCCYFTHAAITAAIALADEHDITPKDIESIEVTAAQGADDALAFGNPSSGMEAKFSMQYCVAAAIVYDHVGLAAFTAESIDKPIVNAIRERVRFTVDQSLPYDSHEATVRIKMADGETVDRVQKHPPGTHVNPLSDTEFREKYLNCAKHVLDEESATNTYHRVASLASEPSIADLVEVL